VCNTIFNEIYKPLIFLCLEYTDVINHYGQYHTEDVFVLIVHTYVCVHVGTDVSMYACHYFLG
jgi:hypothetical protein